MPIHARIQGGGGGQGVRIPTGKSQSYRVSYQYWSGSHGKSQSYPVGIQCWATICPARKRHLKTFCWWTFNFTLLVVFGSSLPSLTKKKALSELDPSDRCQSLTPLTKLSESVHAIRIVAQTGYHEKPFPLGYSIYLFSKIGQSLR